MLWLLSAFATSPEVCDGIDNDLNGSIDDPAVCGATSFVAGTGHAYTSPGIGTASEAASICGAIGYHPADPSSAAENALLQDAFFDGPYWLGITALNGTVYDSTGASQAYDNYPTGANSAECTTLNTTGTWGAYDVAGCETGWPVLCEADCERIPTYLDNDDDGFGTGSPNTACGPAPVGYVTSGGDCDDDDPTRSPNVPEVCNQTDDNCNGQVDEGLLTFTVYPDLDGDGRGDATSAGTRACGVRPGTSLNQNDCDDADPTVFTGAQELCDGIDNDCNGQIDDNATPIPHYFDGDDDGFGAGSSVVTCTPAPGYVPRGGDCDDLEITVYPGAPESCNGVDDDCNGTVDNDPVDGQIYYADQDQDGSGDPATTTMACAPPMGFVADDQDCAPDDALIYPLAPEACLDGIDNDCDLLIDLDDPDYTDAAVTFWLDQDGDGSGVPGADFVGCSGTQPNGYVAVTPQQDCNDAEPQMRPGLAEVCDGLDNDCNGTVDDGLAVLDYWPDVDGDLYGDLFATSTASCQAMAGLVRNQLDCDDSTAARYPGNPEICDELDNDCNNQVDDGLPVVDYFRDLDGDTYGAGTSVATCSPPGDDYVIIDGDCDDTDPDIYPGAPDVPEDGVDSDCDGTAEEPPAPPADTDGDGVPDTIDPTPGGSDPAPDIAAPAPVYGCGCSAGSPARSFVTLAWWIRRR